jgi:adenylylsulfate kinase-like enzyme
MLLVKARVAWGWFEVVVEARVGVEEVEAAAPIFRIWPMLSGCLLPTTVFELLSAHTAKVARLECVLAQDASYMGLTSSRSFSKRSSTSRSSSSSEMRELLAIISFISMQQLLSMYEIQKRYLSDSMPTPPRYKFFVRTPLSRTQRI